MPIFDRVPIIYRDAPYLGVDLSDTSIKVVQLQREGDRQKVLFYGKAKMPTGYIEKGVVVEPNKVAKMLVSLIGGSMTGVATARRVIVNVPTRYTFQRRVSVPKLKPQYQTEAALLETMDDLPDLPGKLTIAFDSDDTQTVNRTTSVPRGKTEIILGAIPRTITDSYLQTFYAAGLEMCAIEPTSQSLARLYKYTEQEPTPTILVDIGSNSVELVLLSQGIRSTAWLKSGGDLLTELIAKELRVGLKPAEVLKLKYGLGVSEYQKEIQRAVAPVLDLIAIEVRKLIQKFEHTSGKTRAVTQIVTTGGGANMPSLDGYLINALRMPVKMCSLWQGLDFTMLQRPDVFHSSGYATAIGLALATPEEIYT